MIRTLEAPDLFLGLRHMGLFDIIVVYRRGWIRFASIAIGVLVATALGVEFDLEWYWSAAIIAVSVLGVPLAWGAWHIASGRDQPHR